MANTGIFITKPGVVLPAVSEMSSAAWASYANDLLLTMLVGGSQAVRAFEAFKYRIYADADNLGIDATINALFNTQDDRNLQFILGTGNSPQVGEQITLLSEPAQIEALDVVFLNGSQMLLEVDNDMGLGLRIASIDGNSHILFDFDSGDWTVTEDGVVNVPEGGNYGTPLVNGGIGVRFAVTSVGIDLVDMDAPAPIYSYARTWRGVITSGVALSMNSSGLATGSWLAFNVDDSVDDAGVVSDEANLLIESNFGQKTNYTIKTGVALNPDPLPEGEDAFEIQLLAGVPDVHDTNDDFDGGVGNLSYAQVSGTIPSGMILTGTGLVQGTPTTDGTYNATIRVTDEMGNFLNLQYSFVVTPSVNVAYNPPAGVVGIPYSYDPQIAGLTAAALNSGVIPTGLALNALTGALTGTPTVAGSFTFTVELTLSSGSELQEVTVVIYPEMVADVVQNGENLGEGENLQEIQVNMNQPFQFNVSGGSGNYQYSITGENQINSNGQIAFYQAGAATVTIVDTVTGQTLTFYLLVAGQGDICGLVVEEEGSEESTNAPCVDIITDCNTPVNIAFNAMQLLRGVEAGETPRREYPIFEENEGSTIQNNGKAFVSFRSTASDGYGIANNARDGKPFILEYVVDNTVMNGANDVAIGVARKFQSASGLGGLEYAAVITTVALERVVEIRAGNVYQAGSRIAILEGQQIGFGVFGNAVYLYVDGILKFTLVSNTFGCSGLDIVFFTQDPNMVVGGKAGNLLFDIESPGTPDEVGTIDPQSGLYTPSLNNVSLVRIAATSTANGDVKYFAKVRVIRPAVKASLEGALIEGIEVDVWIADIERYDELPLRLDRNGRPDKNQVKNPQHLGILAGAGRIEATPTRTEFRNDVGATSSSLTLDKVVITGAFLHIRDMALVKELVPYMREYNSHGVRQLKQFSTGCHKKKRVFLVWRSPDCEDVPVYDAIEVPNGLSYTMFNFEVGKGVQSNIPITIEGFPSTDGILFEYNQYDKHFHRIS